MARPPFLQAEAADAITTHQIPYPSPNHPHGHQYFNPNQQQYNNNNNSSSSSHRQHKQQQQHHQLLMPRYSNRATASPAINSTSGGTHSYLPLRSCSLPSNIGDSTFRTDPDPLGPGASTPGLHRNQHSFRKASNVGPAPSLASIRLMPLQ